MIWTSAASRIWCNSISVRCVPLPTPRKWHSKYLLQYFSIYYQMLTLNLSLPEPPTERITDNIALSSAATSRGEKKIPAWAKELQTFFLSPSCGFSQSRPYLWKLFKWKFNGCLNLQHFAQSYIAFAMHKWLAPLALFLFFQTGDSIT